MMRSSLTRRFRAAVLVLAGIAGLSNAPAWAARGSDGGYGYTWVDTNDGAQYVFAAPDAPTIRNPVNNSAPLGPIGMGITGGFTFYGVTYTQCWISDNGWISFVNPAGNSYPTGACSIPDPLPPTALVAPLWVDIDSSNAGAYFNYYGRIAAENAWTMSWNGRDTVNAIDAAVDVVFYPNGCIKFQYRRDNPIPSTTIGIEGDPADNAKSIQIAACGVITPGVAVVNPYVIDFCPPAILPTSCSAMPVMPCAAVSESLPGTFAGNVLYYGCSSNRYDARERAYQLTLATTTVLNLNLTPPGQKLFLLDACNEYDCLRGPLNNLSIALAAGTYYVVVDAPAVANEGPFSLTASCSAVGTPIACNDTVSATTVGGTSLFSTYSCTGAATYADQERIYSINAPPNQILRARLLTGEVGRDVFILQHAGGGEITGADCIAYGDQQAVVWDTGPGGTFLVVVDAALGASGAFDLLVSCSPGLSCSTPTGSVNFAGGPVQTIRGDNSLATNQVPVYSCDAEASFDAGEDIWIVTLPNPGQLTVYPISGNQSYFILSACNEGTCVGTDRCSNILPAGTYYLVVDHATAGGPYEAMVFNEAPPFPRWIECESPYGSTTFTDTVRNFWNFDDGAFCISDPASYNYDNNNDGLGPDGCLFAMYASVRCGTSLHLPLFDCESGHVRIFDIFQGVYVNLTAQSPTGFFMSGTDIFWDDPLCDGSDPLHNETITDVYFDRPSGLCGIYRLEFPNHSGFVWELYANCLGDRTPVFDIYDSLCGALGAYLPLPSLTLLSASAVYNCPDVTVTYTIKNDGCGAAQNFPVQLHDGLTLVTTDVVPLINPGETLTLSFTTTISVPSGAITLTADSLDIVTECTEVPGAGCDPLTGRETLPLPPCSGVCVIVADAIPTPTSVCLGQTLTIDASTSSSALCPGGVLEYQLRDSSGILFPFPAGPVFSGLAPTMSGNYDVDVRCAADFACTDTKSVNVPVERPPLFPAASVQAVDLAGCNLGIVVSWSSATFYGFAGGGSYNVYRASVDENGDTVVDCADAVAIPAIAVGLLTTSYPDAGTVGGTTYYYVVEAEDATPNTVCVPQGPRNRGATTRVAVNGGVCTGITDLATSATDLLPKVGGTLLAGGDYGDGTRRYGDTFVEFDWNVDSALDIPAGEHFHFYRSPAPDAGFARLTNDTPLLQFNGYTDFGAAQPDDATYIWFYLTFVADSCDNENTASDGGDCGPCPR